MCVFRIFPAMPDGIVRVFTFVNLYKNLAFKLWVINSGKRLIEATCTKTFCINCAILWIIALAEKVGSVYDIAKLRETKPKRRTTKSCPKPFRKKGQSSGFRNHDWNGIRAVGRGADAPGTQKSKIRFMKFWEVKLS